MTYGAGKVVKREVCLVVFFRRCLGVMVEKGSNDSTGRTSCTCEVQRQTSCFNGEEMNADVVSTCQASFSSQTTHLGDPSVARRQETQQAFV